MKNFSKILLAAILGVFLIAGSSSALTITDYITGDGTYVGGVVGGVVYVGTSTSSDPTLAELENPQYHMDSYANVNLILGEYNTQFDPDLPDITTYLKNELEGDPLNGVNNGTIVLSAGTEYISLKWGGFKGGWFLWNVEGLEEFTFSGLDYGLSHYTEWNGEGTPIPEPATMLLLGTGLIGLAGFGRKRLSGKQG